MSVIDKANISSKEATNEFETVSEEYGIDCLNYYIG